MWEQTLVFQAALFSPVLSARVKLQPSGRVKPPSRLQEVQPFPKQQPEGCHSPAPPCQLTMWLPVKLLEQNFLIYFAFNSIL